MSITKISDDFFVGPQIEPSDVAALAQNGFRSVICNRPDNEQAGQPSAEAMGKAATEAGLAFHYIPVVPGQSGRAEVEAMAKALKAADGPVFAYCRSGARSAGLFQAARAAVT
ncbi:TIGR01244 family phosphatase [Chelativorans sp. ZYF759]|uniref:TIGR01244 family sulfur transferase n=1 Tax=Chelativorans sp. ZYF759 TaxID=2692213 RepID=UPI00145E7256|nr:TIGR01244 family sulfur transferase [Chelativorans sp. ZYF759]NMG39356.1 TIGR01244 family phosphatase [Chelativorans sp. ZYF759]